MIVTFPLAMPISWILNYILGEEPGRVYKREELIKVVEVTRDHHYIAEDELEMLTGVLEFKNKTIKDVMTPKADMFLLADNTVLNLEMLRKIQKKGHSRIPVYCHGDESDIMGVLFVKDLMVVNPDENLPVSRIVKQYEHAVLSTVPDTKLDVMLEQFKSGVSHMSLVQRPSNNCEGDPYNVTVGIVTLEDIIEEIIKTEIVDETDIVRDNITKEPVQRKPRENAEAEMAMLDQADQMMPRHASLSNDNPFHLVRFVSDIQPWLNEVDADRLRQMMFKKLLVTDSASIKRLQRIQSRDGQSAHNEELIKLLRVGDLTTFRDLCVAIEELGFVDISKAMRSLLPHTVRRRH
ncbi:metal transporter CNNM2-like [Sycon ciliatum]|uniref:metal transporter CNNM2-like n=1 Tax=Sycon ciliatum TaxID=27933 RepID=UPI0031F71872